MTARLQPLAAADTADPKEPTVLAGDVTETPAEETWIQKWQRENPGRCMPCGGTGSEFIPGIGFGDTCENCDGNGYDENGR